MRESKQCKDIVSLYDSQIEAVADAEVMLEMAEEGDDDAFAEADSSIRGVVSSLADLEFRRMLSGEADSGGAVVSINSGAGGVEACDWASMLLRMVLRYCERKSWSIQIVDEQPAEEAGIKGCTFVVTGEYAYGLLKAEMGVHRLVRISPFDSNARRHTSFASVSVSPDIDDDIDIEINDSDLRIDKYRASGAGGQHVNKTESAIRITHEPTNTVVQCQNERSQHKNLATAMRLLRSKLYELELRKREEEAAAEQATRKKIEWGSQIRSYVLAPYRQVNDHRTELKISQVDAVLDGDLDELIREYLLMMGNSAT